MRTERIRQLLAVAAFYGLFLFAARAHGAPPKAPKWKAADLAPATAKAADTVPLAPVILDPPAPDHFDCTATVLRVIDVDTLLLDCTVKVQVWHEVVATHNVQERVRIDDFDGAERNTAKGKEGIAWAKASLLGKSVKARIYRKRTMERRLGVVWFPSGEPYAAEAIKAGFGGPWTKPRRTAAVAGKLYLHGDPDPVQPALPVHGAMPVPSATPLVPFTPPTFQGNCPGGVCPPAPQGFAPPLSSAAPQGGPLRKAGRWVKQCFGTHCEQVWVED